MDESIKGYVLSRLLNYQSRDSGEAGPVPELSLSRTHNKNESLRIESKYCILVIGFIEQQN